MITTQYRPRGVCSQLYEIDMEDGVIKDIRIVGGCNGNLKGIASLIRGRKAQEVIPLLRGTTCGPRATSCPDQISYALEDALRRERAQ
ncbi:MAG: TIGR03905 family TSCPD domain-containing protein [Oscillospiraceae bacterium]|nr:TIGR03905 family TSCPD domain-containing protein [Oscillospiraceae bacterium]